MNKEKLIEYLQRYNELEGKLLSNSLPYEETISISKEISALSPIVEEIKKLNSNNQKLLELENINDADLIDLAQEEITSLRLENIQIEKNIYDIFNGKQNTIQDAIIEIRPGTGGDEAQLFANELERMYTRYAQLSNFRIEKIDQGVFSIQGLNVYNLLKSESGIHRVQRIPSTEASGRIHTSAVSVVILPKVSDIEVNIASQDIRIDVYRAGGPGGQSVNTTDSAVRINHIPSGIVVSCQDQKSQLKNREQAMEILKGKVYLLEKEKQELELGDIRRLNIKSGDRSEKIRTYNFPQDRVTDHRIKKTWHNISKIMDGEINEILQAFL